MLVVPVVLVALVVGIGGIGVVLTRCHLCISEYRMPKLAM